MFQLILGIFKTKQKEVFTIPYFSCEDKFSILLSQHTSNDSKGGENKNMSKRQIILGNWNEKNIEWIIIKEFVYVCFVRYDNGDFRNDYVNYSYGIRPAMWIKE